MMLPSASECDLHLGHYLHHHMDMLDLIYIQYVCVVSIQIIGSGCALSHAQNSFLFSKILVTHVFGLGNYNGPYVSFFFSLATTIQVFPVYPCSADVKCRI